MKYFYLQFLLFIVPFFSWSQTDDSILKELKNEDLKLEFENYLKHEAIVLNFIVTNAKPNVGDKIEITNLENIAYYDSIVNKLKVYKKSKNFIRSGQYLDLKFKEDKIIIYKRIKKADSIINANYNSRFKIIKTKIQDSKQKDSSSIVPFEDYKKFIINKELSQPTHESCKNLNLSIDEEANCSANFIRNKIVTHIQNYLEEFDVGINISSAIQFVINKEGSLVFDKFTRSSGNLEYDLIVYKGFKSFSKTTKFIPAKVNEKNVSVYYNLPIKIVMEEY